MYTEMKRILIIGAGFLQTFLIKKAKNLGLYVLCVDGNPKAEGFRYADEYAVINIIDEKACLDYAVKNKIDGVITAATDYGVLAASYVANKLNLPGLDYEVAKVVKNKYQVRQKLFFANADDTDLPYEITSEEMAIQIAGDIKYPVMVKPCDGSGSRGATKVESSEKFVEACKFAIANSISHKAIVETFIVGKEYGVETFVDKGVPKILGIMRKWMTSPPYYAELGHSIPSLLSSDIEEYIKTCVSKTINALGIRYGSVNMDLLLTKDNKVHIVDIGARMGGNLIGSNIIPIGTGIDYMSIMLRAAVGETYEIKSTLRRKCVVSRLLALSPGHVKELPDFNQVEKQFNVNIYHHLSVGDTINEYHTNLDGCGYIISSNDDYDLANRNAELALDYINKAIKRL